MLTAAYFCAQVDDAANAAVSAEAAAAAREMGRRGLEERLAAIDMGEHEHESYMAYYDRIASQVRPERINVQRAARAGPASSPSRPRQHADSALTTPSSSPVHTSSM